MMHIFPREGQVKTGGADRTDEPVKSEEQLSKPVYPKSGEAT
jgi:hypothetical protein